MRFIATNYPPLKKNFYLQERVNKSNLSKFLETIQIFELQTKRNCNHTDVFHYHLARWNANDVCVYIGAWQREFPDTHTLSHFPNFPRASYFTCKPIVIWSIFNVRAKSKGSCFSNIWPWGSGSLSRPWRRRQWERSKTKQLMSKTKAQ